MIDGHAAKPAYSTNSLFYLSQTFPYFCTVAMKLKERKKPTQTTIRSMGFMIAHVQKHRCLGAKSSYKTLKGFMKAERHCAELQHVESIIKCINWLIKSTSCSLLTRCSLLGAQRPTSSGSAVLWPSTSFPSSFSFSFTFSLSDGTSPSASSFSASFPFLSNLSTGAGVAANVQGGAEKNKKQNRTVD